MEKQDIENLPWKPLPYEAWLTLRISPGFLGGSQLEFEDLRNSISEKLINLSLYFGISIRELEELFWKKNPEIIDVKTENSYYHTSSVTQPFNFFLEDIFFPVPPESPEIVEIKRLFKSLSPAEQENLLKELHTPKK